MPGSCSAWEQDLAPLGEGAGKAGSGLGQPPLSALCCPLQGAGTERGQGWTLLSGVSEQRGHRPTRVPVRQAPGVSRMWPHSLVAGTLALLGESEAGLSRIIVKVISAVSSGQRERVPGS